jgi:hypothetical protein
MGDSLAYHAWKLSKVIEDIADRYLDETGRTVFLLGDNAYTNSRYLITPYTKPKIISPFHDSLNFHVSQLRMRVEMAFGLLVSKWRIFKKPLEISMGNIGRLLNAIFRLHNFCIRMRLRDNPDYSVRFDEDLSITIPNTAENEDTTVFATLYNATGDENEDGIMVQSPDITNEVVRNRILDYLTTNNIRRPHYNVARQESNDLIEN